MRTSTGSYNQRRPSPRILAVPVAIVGAVVRTGDALITHLRTGPQRKASRTGALLDDDTAFMLEIDAAVDAFWDDVVRDRCASREWYDVDTKTWVEPTDALRASICKGPRVTPIVKERPVTSPEWLSSFNLWMQDWSAFKNKHSVDVIGIGTRANREDLDVWKKQLDGAGGWREQFTSAGGKTIRPKADAPKSNSLMQYITPALWIAGIGVGVYAISTAAGATKGFRFHVKRPSAPAPAPASMPAKPEAA